MPGLGNRIFLMNNVHDDAPIVFETRWAMSYLRGPLTRNQIKQLMSASGAEIPTATQPSATPGQRVNTTPIPTTSRAETSQGARPVLPPEIEQYFVPRRNSSVDELVYQPMILGAAEINFVDAKAGVNTSRSVVLLAPIDDGPAGVDWGSAIRCRSQC